MNDATRHILLLYDLYFLRFEKKGDGWWELTDYLRDKLREDGCDISYTEDDLIFRYKGYSGSIRRLLKL